MTNTSITNTSITNTLITSDQEPNPQALVQQAKACGVSLYLKGDKLAYASEQGRFDPALKATIGKHKALIVEYLQQQLEHLSKGVQTSADNGFYREVKADPQCPVIPSAAQQRLWFIQHFEGAGSQYNLALSLSVKGEFDLSKAQQALGAIVSRHQVLRTVLTQTEDGVEARLLSEREFNIGFTDLSCLSDEQAQQRLEQLIEQHANEPFDLANDLMIRAKFVQSNRPAQGVFMLCMHHIASDGWSIQLLVAEFCRLYQDAMQGKDVSKSFADQLLQYKDFAHWQNQWLLSEAYTTQAAYWTKQLHQLPSLHQLPLDFARPNQPSHKAGVITTEISSDAQQALLAFARASQVTPFMLLHSAFALILAQHANQSDIVIGTAVANRQQVELESLIGFFANTLVLRTELKHQYFSEFLAHVKAVNLEAQANQDVPLERLVELCGIERCAQFSPLFQIMFNMNTVSQTQSRITGLEVEFIPVEQPLARFDLELEARISDTGIEFKWIYDSHLFSAQRITKMAQHLNDLLAVLATGEDLQCSDYSVLSQPERHYLLHQINSDDGSVAKANHPGTMAGWFEQQVVKTPQAQAAYRHEHNGEQSHISYQRLNAAANRLARHLVSLGVKPGVIVGVCQYRNIDLLITLLAITKAGGCYLPMDPEYPLARLQYLVDDSKLALLCSHDGIDVVAQLRGDFNTLHTDKASFGEQLAHYDDRNLDIQVADAANQLAYIIYTSGSTGQPKGVMVSQQNVSALLGWASQNYTQEQLAKVLFSTSVCFDISVFELFAPLCVGGQVVMVDSILSLVEQHQDISLINTVPSAAKLLLEQNALPSKLNTINLAGELLAQSVVERLYQAGVSKVYDLYGPSEDTTFSTRALRTPAGQGTIGTPIGDTRAYVLDEHRRPVPFGTVGELYLAGSGVTLGYWQKPQLTEASFILNPFVDEVEAELEHRRMYRTGDLVRYLADEQLAYVGRKDQQVKIRGFRIEPDEIVAQLLKLDEVTEAVVSITKHGPQQLVAFVVAAVSEIEHQPFVAQIKTSLQQVLPSYMVPHRYVLCQSIPLMSNGKIDYRQLEVLADEAVTAQTYQAPSNEIEQLLQQIWAEVLNIAPEKLSVNDNFFTLGGDSILSIAVVSKVATAGYQLQVKDLFDGQTITQLARRVKVKVIDKARQQPSEGRQGLLPIHVDFFAQPIESPSERDHYNQALMVDVPADLSIDLLKQMISLLVQRHDALRLVFECHQQHWQGVYLPFEDQWVDKIVEQQFESLDDKRLRVLADRVQQSFALELTTEPLVRVVLITQDDGLQKLLMVFHHLLIDGVSWRVILADLAQLYQQQKHQQPLQLAAKTASLQQWADSVVKCAQSERLQSQLSYWQNVYDHKVERIGDLAVNESDKLSAPVADCEFSLSSELTKQLLSQCHQAYGNQINELLLSAILLGVKRLKGIGSVRIDMEGHGRESLDLNLDLTQTVGWFTSVYPLYLACDSDDLTELLCAVKAQVKAVPDNGIGFGLLQHFGGDVSLGDVSLGEGAKSELLFNYLGQFSQASGSNDTKSNAFSPAAQSAGQNVSPLRAPSHALALNGLVAGGCLTFALQYDPKFCSSEHGNALMAQFKQALVEIINHCVERQQRYFTPCDFQLCQLTQVQLDQWQQQLEIDDIYPATGMQQGMLFHSMLQPSSYVSQFSVGFSGLEQRHFIQAWQQVSRRHSVFRTAFVGLEQNNPLQLVCKDVQLPWHIEDLSHLSAQQQQQQIEQLSQAQSQQGFAIDVAPLMRMTLVDLGAGKSHFIWSHHHALLDGWSMPQVFAEVMAIYQASCAGSVAKLAPVVPYKNWLQWLSEQDSSQAQAYWFDLLAEVEHQTPLPLVEPRLLAANGSANTKDKVNGNGTVETVLMIINHAELSQLQAFAKTSEITVNVIIQAAWALLLSRYSGQSKVVFGNTVSGRVAQLADVESMVGLFINALPLVVEVNNELAVKNFLHQIHRQLVEREQFSYLPLPQIQKQAKPKGDLFDSIVVSENHRVEPSAIEQNDESGVSVNSAQTQIWTNYPLSIITHIGDTLQIKFEVKQGLLSQGQSEQILAHFKQLMLSLKDQQMGCLADVSMYTVTQLQQLRQQVETGRQQPLLENMPQRWDQRFSQQAALNGQNPAVIVNEAQLSYEQLDIVSNRLANLLIEMDIGPGSRVGIYLSRCLQLPIAMLGVAKAGASYVALEPTLPASRINYQIADAQIELVLLLEHSLDQLALSGIDVMLLDDAGIEQDWLDDMSDDGVDCHNEDSSGHEAYVLYTSGSTGKPKGVKIHHRALNNYLTFAVGHYCTDTAALSGSVVSSPLCFDATLTTLLTPLMLGLSITLLAEDDTLFAQLFQQLQQPNAKLFKLTPAHLQALRFMGADKPALASHQIVVGGEQLSTQLLRNCLTEQWPNATFYNEYGPTETVVGCCVYGVNQENLAELEGPVVPIGRAIINTRLYLLDGDVKQPGFSPQGSIGELYIGGDSVGLGYLNQPQQNGLSKTGYIDGLAHLQITERLYKTGDWITTNDKGDLVFVGRADSQIKIRGYRIDADEVIATLLSHKQVKQAHVAKVELSAGQNAGQAQLVAWIGADDCQQSEQQTQLAELLSEYLASQLPSYMVPTVFSIGQNLPLTVNGKVDSRQLNAILSDPSTEGQIRQLPQTELQKQIEQVWSTVLGFDCAQSEPLGIDDNFFTLGGDSILSIQVVALMAQQCLHIEVHDLFERPTIRQLAQCVQLTEQASESLLPPKAFGLLTQSERELLTEGLVDAYPMSALQAGMVFHSELSGFDGVYHDINREAVECLWQQDLFEQALGRIIYRYPVLRTGFKLKGEQPLQLVYETVPLPLSVVDLRSLEGPEQQQHIEQWQQTRCQHKFDWLEGPLFVIGVFLIDSQRFEFVLSFHHSILDGWSRINLITQLYQNYTDLLAGQTLEPLMVDHTMAEFIGLEQDAIKGDGTLNSGEYFRQQLAYAPGRQLPWCGQSIEPACHRRFEVPQFASLAEPLLNLAKQLNVPVQVVLLAGHLKLLSCFSGQNSALSCITVNGRPERQGSEQGLGLFLNTVPLVLELVDGSWSQWIEAVNHHYTQLISHRRYPYAQISRLSDSPLDQVLFNYTHFHSLTALETQGDSASESNDRWLDSSGIEVTNFDLLLDVSKVPGKGQMHLFLAYHSDKFNPAFIAQLGQLYVNVFTAMSCDVTASHRICLLNEQQQQLQLTKDQAVSVPSMAVHQLFEQHAKAHPQQLALELAFAGDVATLSYAQLNTQANQLAHYLRHFGVSTSTPVGLCFERGSLMVVSILAVLKAGGAYVPLDCEYPQNRLEYVLDNSNINIVLTCSDLAGVFEHHQGAEVLCVDDPKLSATLAAQAEHNPSPNHNEHSLAYVIYTSGSTGQPKGVMVAHQALNNRISWMDKTFALDCDDKVLQKTPYTFDVSVWEFVWTLAYGATMVIAEPGRHGDPAYLQQVIETHGVSRLHFVPSMLNAFLHAGCRLAPSVRSVFCSGEALALNDARKLKQVAPQVRLFNLYGPTEAAIDVSCYEFDGTEQSGVPIGKAIDNIQLYVLDKQLMLLPQGAVGELYIGGVGLAQGYANQPDLSAAVFIANPFNNDSKARLYKTGDLVRQLADGNLEYLGRCDNQVKLRGLRIELAEVEYQLNQLPQVQASVVLVGQNKAQEQQLVAYVALGSGNMHKLESTDFAGLLGPLLPAYMIPHVYVLLETLPQTSNGKVDRKALPPADFAQQSTEYVAPVNDTEQSMVQIWSELLALPPEDISTTGDFFALGGHSLLAVRLITETNERFGIELALKQVFATPRLASLCDYINQGTELATVPSVPVIIPRLVTAQQRYILSFAQQRLWFIDQFGGGSSQYNMPCAMRVEGSFALEVAEQALRAIIERHHSLRTVYVSNQGEGMQQILTDVEFTIEQHDLSEAGEACEQQLALLQQNHRRRPFDLSVDIPIRVAYVQLDRANDQGVLLFNMHHIAADGWSMTILVKEFVAHYQALIDGSAVQLEPLSIQYSDFSQWQREQLVIDGQVTDESSQKIAAQVDYWREQLHDAPALHGLSCDFERPAIKQYQGQSLVTHLPGATASRLITLARQYEVTPFMLLHGALAQVLSRHSHSADIVIGTPVANRRQKQLQALIGFFANTLVLRTRTDFPTLAEYLAHIKAVNIAAQDHQDIPFEQLVEQLNITRDSAYTPVFQILFTLNTNERPKLALTEVEFEMIEQPDDSAKFDLNISAQINGVDGREGIVFEWNYDTALFSKAHIEQLSQHVLNWLDAVAQDASQPLAQVAILSPAERVALMLESRRSVIDIDVAKVGSQDNYPADNIHSLFAQQLAKTPDGIAVVDDHQSLTYLALEQRANQLSHLLAGRGIAKGQRVGVCIGRNVNLVVAILAVLKTGAAYVPMDPSYPLGRLQYLVQDSGMTLLLIDEQGRFLSDQVQCIDVDEKHSVNDKEGSEIANAPIVDLNIRVDKTDLAYLIYTSGSTGLPKGVMMPHGPLVNLIEAIPVTCDLLGAPLATLQFASAGFDMCFADIFMTLASGGTLRLMDKSLQQDLPALLKLMVADGIERVNLPYAVLAQLAYVANQQQVYLSELKVLISTAEQLKITDDIRAFFGRHPGCRLVNHYGPSETHVVTDLLLPADSNTWPAIPSIGSFITNVRGFILDSQGQLTPSGGVGELYIAQSAIADGYLNRDELSRERFVASPFDQGEKLYRTGDLVCAKAHGLLQYLGRSDQQLKINGFRIEPGEIEHQLTGLSWVSAAYVGVQTPPQQAPFLAAFVVLNYPDDHHVYTEQQYIAQLQQHLAQQLPAHLVPSAFVILEQLPLTFNGKIDQQALPAIDRLAAQGELVPLQTPTEQLMGAIWAELLALPIDKISASGNFFALGGHSLLCVKLQAQIGIKLEVEVSVATIYQASTLRQLAELVDGQRVLATIKHNKTQATIKSTGVL